MATEQMTFKIEGVAPLLLHNGQLADPLNKYARAMKEITDKGRKKTIEDHRALALIEWRGGIYEEDNKPIIPAEMLDAMLVSGAKKKRKGMDFKSGVMVAGNSVIEHDGPPTVDQLEGVPKYMDRRVVRNKADRVARTRPIFPVWGVTFTVIYDTDVVDASAVLLAVENAGRLCGLGDYRPRFGRFEVVSHTEPQAA